MSERLRIAIEQHKDARLRQATLCFFIDQDRILLAMKKRGFAEGKWNGSGGKPKPIDKSIIDTAIRETFEETTCKPKNLVHVATLNFYFEEKVDWNQQVLVFITHKWEGTPQETDEMAPKWFKFKEIPYDHMWADDPLWLPLILQGKKINGDFLFDTDSNNQKLVEWNIKEIT